MDDAVGKDEAVAAAGDALLVGRTGATERGARGTCPERRILGGGDPGRQAMAALGGLGEVVWVCGYIALGYAFSQSIVAISA